MTIHRPKILVTKTLLLAQKQKLIEADFEVTEADFISIKNEIFDFDSNSCDALIFCSQNAVYSALTHPKCTEMKTKNVFCVGLKTKNLLTDNGFNVLAYTGYADDLCEIILLIYNNYRYTFLSGNLRKDTIPEGLKNAGIAINEIQVYQTLLAPKKLQTTFDAILFFSPSGVKSFVKDNKINNEICFCIGNTTAFEVEKHSKNAIIAAFPTIENVIEECINEFR